MGAGPRFSGFGLGVLLAAIAVGSAPSSSAEIRATGKNGLKTEVNGLRGGRCNKGVCRIGGGTNAGKNKFHRFKDFDTRGAIQRVEFDTGGKHNLIVGVTSPKGSWINKALSMSSKANLFFLSPGGLYVGKGAEFINVPKLTLSTADQLKFSEGVFDVFSSTPSSVQDFTTNPLPGVFGLRRSEMEEPVELAAGELPGIHLDGINISLAEELLVDAPGGRVDVTASRLAAGRDEVGGRIVLTGNSILVNGESELIATGKSGGGLIEVGGSWQNRDVSVRQAITTQIEQGAVLDASAIEDGDGGEIVVWSDISNAESVTSVAGTLLAKGGREGGVGGDIETSGFELDVAGIDVDATASQGEQGLWLLDPFDYTLGTSEATAVVSALEAGNAVSISTAASSNTIGSGSITADNNDSTGGTITVDSSIVVSGSGSGSLSLIADKDIQVNAALQNLSGSGDLTLSSKTGVAINSGGSIDWDGGSSGLISISASESGGLTGTGGVVVAQGMVLDVNQVGNTTFAGVISGAGSFAKSGSGTTTLSAANTFSGSTSIDAGTLSVLGSLSDSTIVDVATGATYQVSSADTIGGLKGAGVVDLNGNTLTVNIAAGAESMTLSGTISGSGTGSILAKSGDGTLKLSGANTYEGMTDVLDGVLEISNSSALGTSSRGSSSNYTSIQQGAALHIVGGASTGDFLLAEQLALGSSSGSGEAIIQLVSGSATIANPFELAADSAIEALSGELLLDDTTSSSASAMVTVGSNCGVSASCNLRIGGNPSGGGGIVSTFLNTDSPILSDGINLRNTIGDSFLDQTLTINNNGIFKLSGDSTVAGAVSVDSADLQIESINALLTNSISLNNNAKISFLTDFPRLNPQGGSPDVVTLGTGDQTLFVASGSTVSIDDVTFTGSGNLVKAGEGTLEYFDSSNGGIGTLDYTGETKVFAGSLQVSAGSIATSSISCSGTGTSNLCSPTPTPSPTPEPFPVVDPEPFPVVDPEPFPVVDPEPFPVVDPEPTSTPTEEEPPPPEYEPEQPTSEPEGPPEDEALGVETGLPPAETDEGRELVYSISLAQATPDPSPMTIALSAPMEPTGPTPMEPFAPDPGQDGGGGEIGDGVFGGEGAPDVGPEGPGERADGEGPPEGVGPEGDGDVPSGDQAGADSERNPDIEGADPAALTPPSLSGEGYEVSLSLETSFQMADSGDPSIGAPPGGPPIGGAPDGAGGAAMGGSSSQLNAETTALAEAVGEAAISGGSGGTADSGAGSPEDGVSPTSSGSESDGASATAAAVAEEESSGEAGGEVAAGDGSGGEDGAAGETAEGEDGGDEDDGTAASAETTEGETAEGETAEGEAAGDDGAAGDEGVSEKPKAPSAAVAVKRVDAKRASENLAKGDAQATSRTLQGLNLPDLNGRKTPTPGAIRNALQQVRQRVASGAGPR